MLVAGLAPAKAQTVTLAVLQKHLFFEQTGASTIVFQDASLEAVVQGSSLSGITAPSFVVPSGTAAGTQALSFGGGSWSFLSPAYVNTPGPVSASTNLDAAYGSGFYNFTVNGTTFTTLGFPSTDFFPNSVLATPSTGTWVSGGLQVDAAQSLTITTSVFSGGNFSAGHALIAVTVSGPGLSLHEISVPGLNTGSYNFDASQISLTIPAFSLSSGSSYDVNMVFGTLVSPSSVANTPGTFASADTSLSGAYAVSLFSRETHFTITAVPEPSGWSAMTGAAVFLTATVRRRRRPDTAQDRI